MYLSTHGNRRQTLTQRTCHKASLWLRQCLCVLLLFGAVAALSGCGGGLQNNADAFQEDNFNDPLEPLNRYFFDLTQFADVMFLKPLAQIYKHVVPTLVRNVLSNVSSNLNQPLILMNDILQLEGKRANTTASRIVINTTIGLGGLLDVATHMGYPAHNEDFGQTLAVYGVPAGPYLFIPFLGPSSVRGAVGAAAEGVIRSYFGPLSLLGIRNYSYILSANDVLRARSSRTFTLLENIESSSIDYYAAIRNLYRQNLKGEILNGRLDIDTLPDIEDMDMDMWEDDGS